MIPCGALYAKARQLGFDWIGVAREEILHEELEYFREWLAEEKHGDMAWLAKDPQRRCDPCAVLPGCRSVVIVSLNYLREPLEDFRTSSSPPRGFGRISKYARTRDYHRVFENLLRKLATHIDSEIAPGEKTKTFVDYGPLMERAWAVRAGLGFIGKHTLLINPREGSFHFLGALLTTADFEPSAQPAVAHTGCGDCRRCIDACPTQAITEPWKLDARRCLSYLTIEKKGPIAGEFHDGFSGNLFGCDICQDVCPYNQSRARPRVDSPLGPPIVNALVPLADLIARPAQFLEQFADKASPLKRAGVESLRRNAAIVAGENGDEASIQALQQLAREPVSELPAWLSETAKMALTRAGKSSKL